MPWLDARRACRLLARGEKTALPGATAAAGRRLVPVKPPAGPARRLTKSEAGTVGLLFVVSCRKALGVSDNCNDCDDSNDCAPVVAVVVVVAVIEVSPGTCDDWTEPTQRSSSPSSDRLIERLEQPSEVVPGDHRGFFFDACCGKLHALRGIGCRCPYSTAVPRMLDSSNPLLDHQPVDVTQVVSR